jgi:hypothetical protein
MSTDISIVCDRCKVERSFGAEMVGSGRRM